MTEKKVTVRFSAEGGRTVKAEMQGLGVAGTKAFGDISLAQKSAAASAQAFEAALDAEDRAFDELRASLDPAHAATKRYEDAVEAATRAVKIGAATQDQANDVIAQARTRLDTFGGAVGAVGGGMGGFRSQVQNASYQIGDFAVQVGGGTSAATALAQQLPQLLGGFGLVGAVMGTVAAIGIPLARAFFASAAEAKSAEDAIGDLSTSLDSYKAFVELAASSTADLEERFGSFAGQIRGFADYMQGVTLGQTLTDMDAAIDPLKTGLQDVVTGVLALNAAEAQLAITQAQQSAGMATSEQVLQAQEAVEIYRQTVLDAADAMGLLPAQAVALAAAIEDLGAASGVAQIRDQAAEALDLIQTWYPAGQELPAALTPVVGYLNTIATDTAEVAAGLEDASLQAITAAQAAGTMASSLAAAIGPANGLLSSIGAVAAAAWDAALGMATLNQGRVDTAALGDDERGSQRTATNMNTNGLGQVLANRGMANAQANSAAYLNHVTATDGGGSSGGSSGTSPADQVVQDAEKMAAAVDAILEDVAKKYEQAGKRGADAISGMLTSIIDGSKSAKDALSGLLKQLAEVQIQKAVLGLAGSGGVTGELFASLGEALSVGANANGTSYWRGGPTWVGERGPEILNLPRGSQVINAQRSRQMADGGGGSAVDVRVYVDQDGNWQAAVERISAKTAAATITAYDREFNARARAAAGDRRLIR